MTATVSRRPPLPLVLAVALQLLGLGSGERRSADPIPESELTVGRDAHNRIEIRWHGAPPNSRYLIYTGTSPDHISRATPVAEWHTGSEAKSIRLSNIDSDSRHYFELVDADTGESRIVAERLLPLDGTHNFRDFGGYVTRSGQRVRWGMLYRSDDLADLSRDDLTYLERLGIKLVVDFRSFEEREDAPDRLPKQNPPRVVELEIADEALEPKRLRRRLLAGDLDDVDFGQVLTGVNRRLATLYRDRYARMFEYLAQPGNLPVLLHCAAGKDRTGFGVALILLALDVPEDTVFNDFLLTNRYASDRNQRILTALRFFSLFRTDPEQVRPLLEAKREYLQAAFDTIQQEYGSFDVYLREVLGVSDDDLKGLRAQLVR